MPQAPPGQWWPQTSPLTQTLEGRQVREEPVQAGWVGDTGTEERAGQHSPGIWAITITLMVVTECSNSPDVHLISRLPCVKLLLLSPFHR